MKANFSHTVIVWNPVHPMGKKQHWIQRAMSLMLDHMVSCRLRISIAALRSFGYWTIQDNKGPDRWQDPGKGVSEGINICLLFFFFFDEYLPRYLTCSKYPMHAFWMNKWINEWIRIVYILTKWRGWPGIRGWKRLGQLSWDSFW